MTSTSLAAELRMVDALMPSAGIGDFDNPRIHELHQIVGDTKLPRAKLPGDRDIFTGILLPDGSRAACEGNERMVIAQGLWAVHEHVIQAIGDFAGEERQESRQSQHVFGNPNRQSLLLAAVMQGEQPHSADPSGEEVSKTWRMCDVAKAAITLAKESSESVRMLPLETVSSRTILRDGSPKIMQGLILQQWLGISPRPLSQKPALEAHLMAPLGTTTHTGESDCLASFGCDKRVMESGVFGLAVVPIVAAYLQNA